MHGGPGKLRVTLVFTLNVDDNNAADGDEIKFRVRAAADKACEALTQEFATTARHAPETTCVSKTWEHQGECFPAEFGSRHSGEA